MPPANRNKIRAPRITLPQRNPATSPDGSLGGGMGMNPTSIANTPGILPQLAQIAAGLGGGAAPSLYGTPAPNTAYTPPMLSGNGAEPYKYLPQNAPRQYQMYVNAALGLNQKPTTTTPGMFDAKDNTTTEQGYNIDKFSPYQQVIDGSRPGFFALADAQRLRPGATFEEIKAGMTEMGYQYVATVAGGVFIPGEGTEGQGTSPGAGYTWSNGAWHAPAGEDPNSDIRSVYRSKNRGWVTPEVNRLLNRRRRRRMQEQFEGGTHPTQIRQQQAAAAAVSNPNTGNEVGGLVNFRANFG